MINAQLNNGSHGNKDTQASTVLNHLDCDQPRMFKLISHSSNEKWNNRWEAPTMIHLIYLFAMALSCQHGLDVFIDWNLTKICTQDVGHSFSQYRPPSWRITYISSLSFFSIYWLLKAEWIFKLTTPQELVTYSMTLFLGTSVKLGKLANELFSAGSCSGSEGVAILLLDEW